jgi:hypothetical protein
LAMKVQATEAGNSCVEGNPFQGPRLRQGRAV